MVPFVLSSDYFPQSSRQSSLLLHAKTNCSSLIPSVILQMLPSYKVRIGDNRRICLGVGVVGPDFPRGLLTFLLLLAPCVATLLFPCRYLLTTSSAPMILVSIGSCVSLGFLTLTATANPGVIPKQTAGTSSGPRNATMLGYHGLEYSGKGRDVNIRGYLVKLRYCDTCKS